MRSTLILLFSIPVIFVHSCLSNKDEHKQVVKHALVGLKNGDYNKVSELMDTAYIISFYGSEDYQNKLKQINRLLQKSNVEQADSVVVKKNSIDYILNLSDSKSKQDAVYLILTFSTSSNQNKIKMIQLFNDESWIENFNPPPPIQPGS